MAECKNIIEKVKGLKINPYYTLSYQNMVELIEKYSRDACALMTNSFKFGYLQGYKAARAEMGEKKYGKTH